MPQSTKFGSVLNKVFDKVADTKKANAWFARVLVGLGGEKPIPPSRLVLFNMYYFKYKAKGYELGTLPWYDKNPLNMMIGYNPNGQAGGSGGLFMGINLHYVPITVRKQFIYDVVKSNERRLLSQRPPVFEYDWIKNRWPEVIPGLKSYIPQRMGKLSRIPIVDWESAVQLKSSDFVGISQSQILSLAKGIDKKGDRKKKEIPTSDRTNRRENYK